MINRTQKLMLFSEMIALTKIGSRPCSFLCNIAEQLQISKDDFEYLYAYHIENVFINDPRERILQFHRLILLMDLDYRQSRKAFVMIHNFGLRMGLGYDAINLVLELMDSFPNKNIPSDLLLGIFMVQSN